MVHLADFSGIGGTYKGFRGDSARDLRQMEAESGAQFGTNEFAKFFGFPLPNPVASTNQTPGKLASPLPDSGATGGAALGGTALGDDLAGGLSVQQIMDALFAGEANGGISRQEAITLLADFHGMDVGEAERVILNRFAAAGENPKPTERATELADALKNPPAKKIDPKVTTPNPRIVPSPGLPGGPLEGFEREIALSQDQALGGRRGIFDAVTGPLASGLSSVGRGALGRRFAPLEASFLTDFGAQGLGPDGGGIPFEEFLGGNPQILSQQGLLGRLQSIGQGFGNVTGGEADFLDTFTNIRARDLFKIGATTGIGSRFRDPRRARLNREFDQFLLDNPLGSIIGEIGQGRFR